MSWFSNMTQCQHCDRPVSVDAKLCPHCGKPGPVADSNWWVWLVALLIVGALLAGGSDSKAQETVPHSGAFMQQR
jgi:RNA polymerase subunit RPABC4/transcription elongation factor Spt4